MSDISTYETLLVDTADSIATVTINRAEVRNALNRQVQRDLHVALERLHADDTVGAVVFTGAGGRAFAAGADIGQLRGYDLRTGLAAQMQRLYDEIEAFEKPTIAAVAGYALGGGCELAMACDIRIAGEKAVFGLPETQLAVLPGAGGTQRLARLVGIGRAIEMVLTGRSVDAMEAAEIGLVSAVAVDPVARAREIARQVLVRGPLAVRLAKLVIRTGMDTDQRTGQVVERLAQALLYTSGDKAEGAAAFLEKRPPRFTGQ
ncbi:enoyl-CoA hydratase/isomerase family protein [Nocardia sp. NPDC003963]